MLGVLLLALAGGAFLAAQFSPRQPATVALDVGISFIRLVLPILALVLLQDMVAREIERRQVFSSLAYPRSRARYVLGRYFGVMFVLGIAAMFFFIVLASVVHWLPTTNAGSTTTVALGAPLFITALAAMIDVATVAAFGIFLAVISTTPNMTLLGGLGFMAIARSASTIVALLERERELLAGAGMYREGLRSVQWFVPDLAALDIRSIALYGRMEFLPTSFGYAVAMAICYVALLLVVTCAYFRGREFN